MSKHWDLFTQRHGATDTPRLEARACTARRRHLVGTARRRRIPTHGDNLIREVDAGVKYLRLSQGDDETGLSNNG